MKVFFDTSAFVALAVSGDARHADALERSESLARSRARLYTSNAVLYETWNWLAVRAGPRLAHAFGIGMLGPSPQPRILSLDRDDEAAALALLVKFADVGLSFVDASVIHLVRKHGIDRVFSFDRHFVQSGLQLL